MLGNNIIYIRNVLTLAFVILTTLSAAGKAESIDDLLKRLDNAVANEDIYVKAKQQKLSDIKSKRKALTTTEEIYWNNRQLYDEYFVFDADSAMHYAIENLNIALRSGDKQREYEWRINKSFTLSVTGLLSDAENELALIPVDDLSVENRIKYYGQLAYLYSHIGQLSGHRIIENEDYDRMSHLYEDSISSLIKHDNPDYLWYAASSKVDSNEIPDQLIKQLKTSVDASHFDTRTDAMNCYILSRLYDRVGDKENRLRYMILSAIADVTTANRDIASLNDLSQILLENGDIERAYTYVNYSQKQALLLPNRIRAASLAQTVSEVHGVHEEMLRKTQRRLTITVAVLAVILLSLVLLIVMYRRRSRQLHKSQQKLQETNHELTERMAEITRSKSERDRLIANLQAANARNNEISETLREANYVKEECIGATFGLCSATIARFEKYRNEISKLVRAQKWKELQAEVLKDSRINRELKEFYHNFDTLFLNIYPDFVSDFNSLLRPEEQITIAPGTLNTELRIYALVRLGISDSVKIAKLLHCSPQTVYNYRLRMRNKAVIPKDEFADAVKSLGKFSP